MGKNCMSEKKQIQSVRLITNWQFILNSQIFIALHHSLDFIRVLFCSLNSYRMLKFYCWKRTTNCNCIKKKCVVTYTKKSHPFVSCKKKNIITPHVPLGKENLYVTEETFFSQYCYKHVCFSFFNFCEIYACGNRYTAMFFMGEEWYLVALTISQMRVFHKTLTFQWCESTYFNLILDFFALHKTQTFSQTFSHPSLLLYQILCTLLSIVKLLL